jgi:S1-C subfamily serine protease
MAPRTAIVVAAVAALSAGCGRQSGTATVTVIRTVSSIKAGPSTRGPAAPVSASVIARAEYSVVDAACTTTGQSGVQTSELGTAFAIVPGNASVFITASHVAAMCVGGSMGANDATVAITRDDVTHDLAVLQETDGGPPVVPRALGLNEGGVRVGEPLALIGYSGQTGAVGKVGRLLVAVRGTVVATNQPQTLTSPQGLRETLSDTIEVAADGVSPGESGGPAIDAAGKVVGVIEGAGSGVVSLTPAADLTSSP